MSSEISGRAALMTEFLAAFRRVREQAVLLNEAVAEHLNMAASDVECLALLATAGGLTAGRLAELTGLSTGAVTRMIDRLEQAGYVRRTSDPGDRRRVVVEAVPERAAPVSKLFASIGAAIGGEMSRYSDDELRFLVDFLNRSAEATRVQADGLRTSAPTDGTVGPHSYSAALGSITSGRLVFMSGFSDLALGAETARDRLFTATFAGVPPKIRIRGGIVAITAVRSARQWLNPQGELSISASIPFNFDLRHGLGNVKADMSPRVEVKTRGRRGESDVHGVVLLNTGVPWEIDVHGGLSRLRADLRSVNVASFGITGGASATTILLPRPQGWASVRLVGGSSDVTIRRPAGTAVRLRIRGGVSGLDLDDQHFPSMGGGDVRLESRGGSGESGYEVEIVGGASRLAILLDTEDAPPDA